MIFFMIVVEKSMCYNRNIKNGSYSTRYLRDAEV